MSVTYTPAAPQSGGHFCELRADYPTPRYLVLMNGTTATGYEILQQGMEFGMPAWKHQFSGARGTLGALPATGAPENRTMAISLYVQGTSKDNLATLLSDLTTIIDGMRRYGGRVTFRMKNQTYKQHATVLAVEGMSLDEWGVSEQRNAAMPKIEFTVAPYLLGDPLDITDTFATDSITASDYTVDAGAASNVAVNQSRVNGLANLTTENRFIHTTLGYTYAEGEATLKLVPGTTITSIKAGVIVKRTAADTYVECYLDDDGTNSRLRLDTIVAGSRTNRKSVNQSTRMTTGTPIWIRGRTENGRTIAEYFTTEPTPMATATLSRYYFTTPSGGVFQEFGPSRKGYPGIVFTPQSANAYVTNFAWKPWTYYNRTLPESHMPQVGAVPGDAEPLAELEITHSGGTVPPVYAYVGWAPEPTQHNLCYNGDFESSTYGTTGWVVTAVASVCGAATSITRVTTAAKYGTASGEVVVPNNATADKGASFRIPRPTTEGQVLFAGCWVRSAAATDNVQILLGNTTDGVTAGTVATLSTTWQFITCVMSTVLTAHRTEFYAAVVQDTINTAATWQFDGFFVMDANPAIINGAIAAGATSVVVDAIPDEWPDAVPYLVTNELNEIMRVTAVSGTTLTIERGVEGTTASAQSDAGRLYVLPARAHYEGKGAAAPFGVIKAEGAVTLSNWAVTSDADYINSSGLQYTTSSSPLTAGAAWMLDPSLLVPADYSAGELAIEFYACVELASTVVSPVLTLEAQNELGADYGIPRYTDEWGSAGVDVTPPSAGTVVRLVRLGTIPFLVDRAQPIRWVVLLTASWASTATGTFGLDYLWCAPSTRRASSPSGVKRDDGYPDFTVVIGETSRLIKSDLAGAISSPPNAYFPMQGLAGNLLEFPANWRGMVKLSTLVPSDPVSDAIGQQKTHAATIHYAMTPRWHILRG